MKIECYNERNARSCNVRLTNLVETVNAAGINISLPQGVIKLNISTLITHLKFMLHGVQWIVKVTNRVSLGNDLYNVSYSIDWLNDYWLKYADNVGHYMIARTTVNSLIDPMLTDGERSFSADTTRTTTTGFDVGASDWYICVVVNTYKTAGSDARESPSSLIMPQSTWYSLQNIIISNTNLQNAIIRVFLVPASVYSTAAGTITNRFYIYAGDGTEKIEIPAGDTPRNFKEVTKGTLKLTIVPGVQTSANDWLDVRTTAHTLHIPGVGTVPLNPLTIGALSTVEMWYNIVDGTLSATVNGLESTRTGNSTLPSVAWTTSTQPQAIRNITTQAIAGGAMAAVGIAAGVATGGAGAIVAGAIGIGVNMAAQMSMAEYGANNTSASNGWDMVFNSVFVLTTAKPVPMLTNTEQQTAYGLPSGKPVEHLSDLVPGYYWLDCSNALIYGGTDYEPAYRQALHNVRINVN